MSPATVRDDPPTDIRSALLLVTTALVAVWLAVLGHEAAHFGIGRLVYSPRDLASGHLRLRPHITTVAAGPLFTLLTVAGSVIVMPLVRTWRGRVLVGTVLGSAASRLLLTAPPTLLGQGQNDERTVGHLLGVSPRLLWGLESVLVFWAIFVAAKYIPENERRSIAAWVCIALVIGWATAFPLGRAAGLPI